MRQGIGAGAGQGLGAKAELMQRTEPGAQATEQECGIEADKG